MRRWWRLFTTVSLKPYDYVVILVAVAIILTFSTFALQQGGPAAVVEIKSDAGTFVYSLEETREITFSGPLGETHVAIHDGAVRFTESPCRDKICIAAGELTESGQWAACLPNRVFIRVAGSEAQDGADAVDATAF